MELSRRNFLGKIAGSAAIVSAGCIDRDQSSPSIEIKKPANGSNVSKSFELMVDVSGYDLLDLESVGSNSENAGFVVVSVEEDLEAGSKLDISRSKIYAFDNGETRSQIEISRPQKQTIYAYLVQKNKTVTEYSDEIEIKGDFDLTSEVLIGENGAINVNPNSIVITKNQTINFKWRINGVDLTVTKKPEGSDWTGVSSLKPKGYTHSHKFTSKGTFKFECRPHEGAMKGTIDVI